MLKSVKNWHQRHTNPVHIAQQVITESNHSAAYKITVFIDMLPEVYRHCVIGWRLTGQLTSSPELPTHRLVNLWIVPLAVVVYVCMGILKRLLLAAAVCARSIAVEFDECCVLRLIHLLTYLPYLPYLLFRSICCCCCCHYRRCYCVKMSRMLRTVVLIAVRITARYENTSSDRPASDAAYHNRSQICQSKFVKCLSGISGMNAL